MAPLIRLGGESIIIPIGSSVALEEEEDSRREYTDRKKEEKKKEVGSSFSDLVSECHPPPFVILHYFQPIASYMLLKMLAPV